jgi:hypothetical protein
MLGNPNPSGPFAPITTLLPAEDLYVFLWMVRDQVDCTELYQIVHKGEEAHMSVTLYRLSVKDSLKLVDVADRFDCEALGTSAKLALEVFYATLGAWELLEVASEVNSIPIAKRAIIKMTDDTDLDIDDLSDWWALMRSLRPTWHIELTKLVWVFQNELVNRPLQERKTLSNGRKEARMREPIMVRTTDSWSEVADDFNPESEASH